MQTLDGERRAESGERRAESGERRAERISSLLTLRSPLKYKTYGDEKMAEWEKVEKEIFKFEKEGDFIEGKLLAVVDSPTYSNKVYTIETKQGNKTVFGTVVIDSQMQLVKMGQMIKILYVGEKSSDKKGYNPIKLFEIYVKK
jgi:hypothetical protein